MTDYHQSETMPVSHDRKKTQVDSKGQHQFIYTYIFNNTQYSLSLIQKNLEWGRWVIEPPLIVEPHSEVYFCSRGTLFGGIEGEVEYSIFDGSFKFYWSYSFWGTADYKLTVNDPKSLYDIYRKPANAQGDEIYVSKKNSS